jgi:hypothetical protein
MFVRMKVVKKRGALPPRLAPKVNVLAFAVNAGLARRCQLRCIDKGGLAMSDAARLRAQKAYSTDPKYLERMALAEEARPVHVPRNSHGSAVTSDYTPKGQNDVPATT